MLVEQGIFLVATCQTIRDSSFQASILVISLKHGRSTQNRLQRSGDRLSKAGRLVPDLDLVLANVQEVDQRVIAEGYLLSLDAAVEVNFGVVLDRQIPGHDGPE